MALTTVKLTAGVTGTLPIANGGTNSTSTTFVNLATNITGTTPIANGGTAATTLAGAGLASTPAFEAQLSSDQAVGDNVDTKLAANTEIYDTDSDYDNSSDYRFTPQSAGKYFVYGNIYGDPQSASDLVYVYSYIKKNGSTVAQQAIDTRNNNGREFSVFIQAIVDMDGSSDYVELWGNVNAADGAGMEFVTHSRFGAYRIIGA